MTATERLRQLLDERGVEWIDFDGEPTWMGNDRMHYARQECSCDEPTDEVTVYHLTPEQAVEATLGEEIVRCQDCKRFSLDNSDHDYRSGWWCHRWNTDMVEPDGFCAWGKRRKS